MSGLWLVSYLLLWTVVIGLSLLLVGLLQQVGLLQRRLEPVAAEKQNGVEASVVALKDDGPPIGSPLPELAVETFNGFGALTPAMLRNEYGSLLVFLSPLCESCQYIIEPLNKLVDGGIYKGQMAVIVRADEQTCRAFLSLFPVHVPVICDNERTISKGFNIHRNPLGLLYDADGLLIRKGIILEQERLLALLGDASVSLQAQSDVFPPPASSDVLV